LSLKKAHHKKAMPAEKNIPPPPSADASPEEKDRYWLEHVYAGDGVPQLTWRSVLTGAVIGGLMALSNLYTTVKLGWAFGVTITSCVLAYTFFQGLRGLTGGRLRPLTMLENNCMQSTASAAGYSTGGTVGTAFGALLLMSGRHEPWTVLTLFVFFTAALGVWLAVPLKRQMINHEQLTFPSGVATAEVTRRLYEGGREAAQKAWLLLAGMAVGALVGFWRNISEWLTALADKKRAWAQSALEKMQPVISLFHDHPLWTRLSPATLAGRDSVTVYGYAFEPSALLIAAGMLTGWRVAGSMFLGSLLLYYGATPWLLAHDAAHAQVADHIQSLPIKNNVVLPFRWGVWGGSALMIFASLTTLGLGWSSLARAFRQPTSSALPVDERLRAVEVPMSWFWWGVGPIALGLVITLMWAFQLAWWLAVLAVMMSFVVGLVCCRATGETDTTPIGAMGKVTQLLYAVLPGASGVASINLMAAGATSSSGGSAADLLTDLKSGYLLGANPRQQFIAQALGIFFGTATVVVAWPLMFPTAEALEKMNPPSTLAWKATAELLAQGVKNLPSTAVSAIIIGALIGVILPLVGHFWKKAQKFLPSAMGLGLGLVLPWQNSLSFFIGAMLLLAWQKWHQRSAEAAAISIASGLIAGEGLMAALIIIARSVVG
jgi:uncharacterized oligopeptide transporter (OPT) family protein